jgi:nucleoid DNA-binding protein
VELAHYLRNILYNHDVVAIPGLGSFVTKYKPAEIDKSTKTISPPIKYLTFDPTLYVSDHLLAQHISVVKNINLLKAEAEVSRIINQLKYKLDTGETVLLEGIGYLSKAGNKIRFDRDPDSNFNTDSYGLSNIEFESVEMDLSPHIAFDVIKKSRKVSASLIVTMVLLIIFFGGAAYVYFNYSDKINEYAQKVVSVFKQKDEPQVLQQSEKDTTKQDEITSYYDSATDKKVALSITEQKQSNIPVKDSIISKPVTPGTKYYIIAGSFKTMQKAKVLAGEIEKDGYKTEIIKFDNIYRITLGVFSDKSIGLQELAKIRERKGDNSVWLLTH